MFSAICAPVSPNVTYEPYNTDTISGTSTMNTAAKSGFKNFGVVNATPKGLSFIWNDKFSPSKIIVTISPF